MCEEFLTPLKESDVASSSHQNVLRVSTADIYKQAQHKTGGGLAGRKKKVWGCVNKNLARVRFVVWQCEGIVYKTSSAFLKIFTAGAAPRDGHKIGQIFWPDF